MASIGQSIDTISLKRAVLDLYNKTLINILKEERLPHSGVKSAMQKRLAEHIDRLCENRNIDRLNHVRNMVMDKSSNSSPIGPKLRTSTGNSPTTAHPRQGLEPPVPSTVSSAAIPQRYPSLSSRLFFKDSPFYSIQEQLTGVQVCPAMSNNRQTVHCSLVLSGRIVDLLMTDPHYRVMIYCAADCGLGPYTKLDIAFPHQVEIKVNDEEVKANTRGLKNKPGSTRPVDITPSLKRIPGYQNRVSLTYALTQKKFSYVVNLVNVHQVEELVQRLMNGRVISKERVIKDMVSKARDTEIEETSEVMSLKCPLSTRRIDLPCRSTMCSHKQCFDATSFLQLQEQAPVWACPICNKIFTFAALVVDDYVKEILSATPTTLEQVTIHPNGDWTEDQKLSSPHPLGHASRQSEDEDIVEIRSGSYQSHMFKNLRDFHPQHESSSASPTQRAGGKRPISSVIDLTVSEDEDDNDNTEAEGPYRATKKQAQYIAPTRSSVMENSMPGNRICGQRSGIQERIVLDKNTSSSTVEHAYHPLKER